MDIETNSRRTTLLYKFADQDDLRASNWRH